MGADRELILKLQNNDQKAFDTLYWKYHKAIYQNALKITKNEDAAADVMQEVFSILWEKRFSIRQEQFVSGWLFVICFNQSVNFQRKKIRDSVIYGHAQELSTEDENDGYDFRYSLIQKAIEQLSPQKQKVFILCKFDGKSYDETAGILGISKHTVKEYLGYAMISVKDYVKKNSGAWNASALITFLLEI